MAAGRSAFFFSARMTRKRFVESHAATSPANPQLGMWLSRQRTRKKKGTLSGGQIALLTALGVVWDPHDAAWEQRYQELVAFKAREGHCNVPAGYPANRQLGMWLNNQRARKKKGTLSAERIALLTDLGVVWNLRKKTRA